MDPRFQRRGTAQEDPYLGSPTQASDSYFNTLAVTQIGNYIGRLSGLTWRLQKVLEPGMRGCVSRLMCLNRSLVNI
ncbi:hypothetical protein LINPERPRIM_LOCUS37527 [Linum perenne]